MSSSLNISPMSAPPNLSLQPSIHHPPLLCDRDVLTMCSLIIITMDSPEGADGGSRTHRGRWAGGVGSILISFCLTDRSSNKGAPNRKRTGTLSAPQQPGAKLSLCAVLQLLYEICVCESDVMVADAIDSSYYSKQAVAPRESFAIFPSHKTRVRFQSFRLIQSGSSEAHARPLQHD